MQIKVEIKKIEEIWHFWIEWWNWKNNLISLEDKKLKIGIKNNMDQIKK